MRAALLALLVSGCGVLDGASQQPALATLHLHVVVPPADARPSRAALVWYAGPSTVATIDQSERVLGLSDFEVDIVTLPPASALVTVGPRRVALGQLVFYTDLNQDGAPTLDGSDTVAGAPMNAQLLYLEGPAVTAPDADPARLVVNGAQPGFEWLSVPAPEPCVPTVLPTKASIDFGFYAKDGPPLCRASIRLPSCATAPRPLVPACP